MSLPFSPAGCCCCPPLDDFCTACGADGDLFAQYEVVIEGLANCDPPLGQACDDCPDYDGTYWLAFDHFFSNSATLRRCHYTYVLPEATCNNGAFPPTNPDRFAVSRIELSISYVRLSRDNCYTVLVGGIDADQLPITTKARFRLELPGLVSCRDLRNLTLCPADDVVSCGNNVACDFSAAVMRVNYYQP